MSENQDQENPILQPTDDDVVSSQAFDSSPEDSQAESSEGMNDVESLRALLAEKEDQLLRAVAETENVRKRGRRETEDARKYASAGLLTDLLTVVDDLNRALESADQTEESEGLLAGVKMVANQLESILDKHHCHKIQALGQPFDPNLHEAIQMQPSPDVEPNHVSLETRTGYQLHDRVLRTSQVFVSTGPGNNE